MAFESLERPRCPTYIKRGYVASIAPSHCAGRNTRDPGTIQIPAQLCPRTSSLDREKRSRLIGDEGNRSAFFPPCHNALSHPPPLRAHQIGILLLGELVSLLEEYIYIYIYYSKIYGTMKGGSIWKYSWKQIFSFVSVKYVYNNVSQSLEYRSL